MAPEEQDINEVIENYEKQFANTETASKIVQAEGLMTHKLHAVTNELINIALHGEKEETRLKAILAIQRRIMGSESISPADPANDMFKMLEAKSAKRARVTDANKLEPPSDRL